MVLNGELSEFKFLCCGFVLKVVIFYELYLYWIEREGKDMVKIGDF